MTIPRGFGKGWDEPKEPRKKCFLGKSCEYSERCTIHQWTFNHDEAWLLLKIILGFALLISTIVIGVIIYNIQWESSHQSIYINIEGFNCKQLAEYVADKSESYTYAEHRYEWLCVNQQVKEFQG